ncbi:unnamed protein product, partial [Sphacelaria rigidula]
HLRAHSFHLGNASRSAAACTRCAEPRGEIKTFPIIHRFSRRRLFRLKKSPAKHRLSVVFNFYFALPDSTSRFRFGLRLFASGRYVPSPPPPLSGTNLFLLLFPSVCPCTTY